MKQLNLKTVVLFLVVILFSSCGDMESKKKVVWAEDILGNPEYRAISYGGYREKTRDDVPTIEEIKEDMLLLHAIGIRIVRTYNTQQFEQVANLLEAIKQLKVEDPKFEMYVMLGAWIDCKHAWTEQEPDHEQEDPVNNKAEIDAAVRMANAYPGIVKIIAVGNEAMVHWATAYFVQPGVILKWVNYLQDLKAKGNLHGKIWITSSDNFASWGGGDASYHKPDLEALIQAVDYISLHTYPYHDTHYHPTFWKVPENEVQLSKLKQIEAAMKRSVEYSKGQYQAVQKYVDSLGIKKELHIGESGWATNDHHLYGDNGSKAIDEYKQKLFHDQMRAWTDSKGISCFYFEAFDEQWKDSTNVKGSENHFGLITLEGEAKFLLWDEVDKKVFKDLKRGGKSIIKSYSGDKDALLRDILSPPLMINKNNNSEN